MSFTIDAPVRDLTDALTDFQRRQLPFATALGITTTLQDAQKVLRKELGQEFTIRNTFLEKGIRIRRATKRRLVGAVFTVDEILQRQITGGVKEKRGHAIPLPREIKGNARGILRAAKRPAALRNRPRHFVQGFGTNVGGGIRHDRGDRGLFKRRTKKRYPIVLLWRLEDSPVRIEAAFDFEAIAGKVIRTRFDRNFGKALARALATAR